MTRIGNTDRYVGKSDYLGSMKTEMCSGYALPGCTKAMLVQLFSLNLTAIQSASKQPKLCKLLRNQVNLSAFAYGEARFTL